MADVTAGVTTEAFGETVCIPLLFIDWVILVDEAGGCAAFVAKTCDDGEGESLERTTFDDVMGFCTAVDVNIDVVLAPATATGGELIRMLDAVAAADVALLDDAGGSFCCDGVETAADDVVACGGDVTGFCCGGAESAADDDIACGGDVTDFCCDGAETAADDVIACDGDVTVFCCDGLETATDDVIA